MTKLSCVLAVAVIAALPETSNAGMMARQDYALYIGKGPAYCTLSDNVAVEVRRISKTGVDDVMALKDVGRPLLLVDPEGFGKLPPWMQAFLFYRECGLHQIGAVTARSPKDPPGYTKDQIVMADCWAMKALPGWAKSGGDIGSNVPQMVYDQMLRRGNTTTYATSMQKLRSCFEGKS